MGEAAVVAILAVPVLEVLAQERLVVGAMAATRPAQVAAAPASAAVLRTRVEVVPAIRAPRVAVRHAATSALEAATSALEATIASVGGATYLLRWLRVALVLLLQ
jgi:hypothetical protein